MNTELRPRLYACVFLVALATLLLEIALTRVLSFSIWYHFAYVVVSLALMGAGASGALLAVRPEIARANPGETVARCCVASSMSTILLLCFVSAVPLHPTRIFESPAQLGVLVLYQCVGVVPFFFSGLAITIALREAVQVVHRVYFWDLVGAALGCAIAVPVMNGVSPPGSVLLAGAVFAIAALRITSVRSLRVVGVVLVAATCAAAPFSSRIPFTVADSKHLALTLDRYQMEPVWQRWTALFRTDVVHRTERTAFARNDEWGLSRRASWPVQEPWGFLLHDATAGAPIYDLREGRLDFLDDHVLRLPYLVSPPQPRVLVIGVGGGRDIIAAKRFGASRVTGVELDPTTVELIRTTRSDLADGLFTEGNVKLVAAEGRNFIQRSNEVYDVIQMTGVDTLAATASGVYVLAENYLYTVEAFERYLERLSSGGVLSIATGLWRHEQPKAAGRMLNVAREALLRRGVSDPSAQIVVVHSKRLLAEVMIKNEPFSAREIAALESEVKRLEFLPLVLAGRGAPVWEALAAADGPKRAEALASQPHRIEAVFDDNPFFFHFFAWSDLLDPEELGPVHTSALAQLILLVLLVSLTAIALVLMILPLILFKRRGVLDRGYRAWGMLAYFLAIGVGFMLLEVSLMQRLVLYLGYPTYAISVVLCILLTSLGLGAALSPRWIGREARALPCAVGILACLSLAYLYGLPPLQAATLGAPLWVRIAICVPVLAPLGMTLGVFLPLGMRRAGEIHRDLVPWAWAVNGSASVTATVLGIVLAMTYGFARVWMLAVSVYAAGTMIFLAAALRTSSIVDRLDDTGPQP